jgi:hypothetical protein
MARTGVGGNARFDVTNPGNQYHRALLYAEKVLEQFSAISFHQRQVCF